jgi:hypothetical protein
MATFTRKHFILCLSEPRSITGSFAPLLVHKRRLRHTLRHPRRLLAAHAFLAGLLARKRGLAGRIIRVIRRRGGCQRRRRGPSATHWWAICSASRGRRGTSPGWSSVRLTSRRSGGSSSCRRRTRATRSRGCIGRRRGSSRGISRPRRWWSRGIARAGRDNVGAVDVCLLGDGRVPVKLERAVAGRAAARER